MAKILIVEDEPNMVAGLRDNFEFEGYQAVSYTHLTWFFSPLSS